MPRSARGVVGTPTRARSADNRPTGRPDRLQLGLVPRAVDHELGAEIEVLVLLGPAQSDPLLAAFPQQHRGHARVVHAVQGDEGAATPNPPRGGLRRTRT